jgi:hypothetical protein
MWVGEGTGRVCGTSELDECEAAGAAGDAVLGHAYIGHLPETREVAAEVCVAGARRDASHEQSAVLRQPHILKDFEARRAALQDPSWVEVATVYVYVVFI